MLNALIIEKMTYCGSAINTLCRKALALGNNGQAMKVCDVPPRAEHINVLLVETQRVLFAFLFPSRLFTESSSCLASARLFTTSLDSLNHLASHVRAV